MSYLNDLNDMFYEILDDYDQGYIPKKDALILLQAVDDEIYCESIEIITQMKGE